MGTHREIIVAYRHLYQHGLRAVQYSAPARYTLRDRLRDAFRKGSPSDFSNVRVTNTIEFLKGATREKGIEHKIIKTLLFVWYYEKSTVQLPKKHMTTSRDLQIRAIAYSHFRNTVNMLNDTMHMYLP